MIRIDGTRKKHRESDLIRLQFGRGLFCEECGVENRVFQLRFHLI
jgi:hypothetical protein